MRALSAGEPPPRRLLRVLGVFRVYHEGRVLFLPVAAGRRVLGDSAVNGAASREQVAAALWPELPERRAKSDLRTVLWRLRQVCPGFLESTDQVLALADDVQVDLEAVNVWAANGISPSITGTLDGAEPPPGAGLELLPGWDEDWLTMPRERLRMLQVQSYEARATRLLAAGRVAEAFRYALHVAQSEPMRESAQCLMLEIHLRQGNVSDALRHYEAYRHMLSEEMGIEPGVRITSLIAQYAPRGSVAIRRRR